MVSFLYIILFIYSKLGYNWYQPQNIKHFTGKYKFLDKEIVKKVKCDRLQMLGSFKFPELSVIYFADDYTSALDKHLPRTSNITRILFNDEAKFNKEIFVLPSTLTHLRLGNTFNHPLNALPLSLTHLDVGNEFNQSLNSLPAKLQHLLVGDKFNLPIDHLPKTLTHLYLGSVFDQKVDHLPSTLTHLSIGSSFNQTVEKLPNLQHLELGEMFSEDANLPNSITNLFLFSTDQLTKLPENLRFISGLSKFVDVYPNNLLHMAFSGAFNTMVKENDIPTTLTHVEFEDDFNSPIEWLPPHLKLLLFGTKFNQPIPLLPKSLVELYFGEDFNQPLEGKLPSTLKSLTLSQKFTQIITSWPMIERLIVNGSWLALMGFRLYFPASITHLCIYGEGCWTDSNIKLPPKLTHLAVCESTYHSIPCGIPSTVTELDLVSEMEEGDAEAVTLVKNSGGWLVRSEYGRILHQGVLRPSLRKGICVSIYTSFLPN